MYKIADFYFKCIGISEALQAFCKNFLCEDPPRIDHTFSVSREEIEWEQSLATKAEREGIAEYLFEGMALQRKVCAYVLAHDAFLMHGVAVEYQGKGYIFSAPSGTGKTTHVRLWKKVFGAENVVIINGDKPILRFIDGKVYAYGTPWNGKEKYGTTGRVAVNAVCFIKRGETDTLSRLSDEQAIPLLFSQIMILDSSDLAEQLVLADRFVQDVPFYQLHCTISEEAAKVAYEGMQG